jgi:hypothetical protein
MPEAARPGRVGGASPRKVRSGGIHSDAASTPSEESIHALPLIDAAKARGFAAETAAMDKGYDVGPVYDPCEDRGVRPIIPLRDTPAVLKGDHKPPSCEHGEWRFAGADISGRRRSLAARPASASPPPSGSQGRPAAPADPARDSPLDRSSRSAGASFARHEAGRRRAQSARMMTSTRRPAEERATTGRARRGDSAAGERRGPPSAAMGPKRPAVAGK